MAWCRDPLVAQLNAMGFNALRVPRSDYEPSKLLIRQGTALPTLFGSLTDGFTEVCPPEFTIGAAGQLANVSSAKYRKGLGLKLICDWLSSSPAKLESAFNATKHISFRFGDVRLLSVPLAVLSQTIYDAEQTKTLANVVNARLFVISEVLQVKDFIIIAEGGSTQAIDASVSILDGGTAGELTIDSSRAHAGILVFKATKHHSIGFKAYEIEVSGGYFRLAPSAASTALSHMNEDEPAFEPTLFDEHNLL